MLNVINHQEDANKTPVRYHFTPTRRVTIRRQTTTSVGKNIERSEPSHTTNGDAKWDGRFDIVAT